MTTGPRADETLLQEAQRLGGHRTRKEAVNATLSEYVQRRKQLALLELFNQIDYIDDRDYKKQRRLEVK